MVLGAWARLWYWHPESSQVEDASTWARRADQPETHPAIVPSSYQVKAKYQRRLKQLMLISSYLARQISLLVLLALNDKQGPVCSLHLL